ncbi:MAG: class I SAM-dependent methyltransferase [Bacteroidia bacterium]
MERDKVGFVETPRAIADLMVALSSAPLAARVLDTGCGRGVFLDALLRKGFSEVWGIEWDPELYTYCQRQYGAKVKLIHGDFLNWKTDERFDLIIGNPPYVHFNSLPESLRSAVSRLIGTAEGDIYYAFILRALSLLKEGGELIYIVPYSFFYNTHARSLRGALLRYGRLEVVIDLDESRLFAGENPETIIFRFRRGAHSESFEYLRIKQRHFTPEEIRQGALETLAGKAETKSFRYSILPHPTSPLRWGLSQTSLDFPFQPLKAVAKVGVGLVSGLDAAFHVEPHEVEALNPEEKSLLHRLVKAQHCRTPRVQGYASYFIIPYSFSEKELRERLPYFFQRFRPYCERLRKRYLPPRAQWFHWQALRNYSFIRRNLHRKRLYIPTLTRQTRPYFALGEGGLWPGGDVLFIQPYDDRDLYWLYAYLNSNLFWQYYLRQGLRRGGRHVFTQRTLEELIVPLLPENLKTELSEIGMTYERTGNDEVLEEVEVLLGSLAFTGQRTSLF